MQSPPISSNANNHKLASQNSLSDQALPPSFDSRENQVGPSDSEKLHISRRASFEIGAIALFSQGLARAEDPATFNVWWLTGPIPAPTVTSH
jgi:hypothetical protein